MIEITFDSPAFLWYLLSIPLLVYTHFYLMKHTKLKAVAFANFDAIKRVSGEKLITKNITVLTIRVLLLVFLVLAMCGTTFWYEGNVSQNDFVIAIDTSASMAAQDIPPTRLEAAKSTAKQIVETLGATSKVAILSFSGTTFIESEMTDNKELSAKHIEKLEIAKAGGTDIPGAIITGTNLLLTSQKGRSMVLITDGSSTVSTFISEALPSALEYAQRNHIVIHGLGIGSESGPIGYLPQYYNISAIYSENTLLQISNMTGGKYHVVNTPEELAAATQDITSETDKAQVPVKLSAGFLFASLFLLFLEWGLISTRFRRIP